MNYFILIIVAIVGVALGMYLPRPSSGQVARRGKGGFISGQMEQKDENKQKILEFVQEHGKVQNNDAEKLTSVSNATPRFLRSDSDYKNPSGVA